MAPLTLVNRPAPDFTLPDLDGKERRLSETRGRILVLAFWSAECPHAARLDADLARLATGWPEEVVLWRVACMANEAAALIRDRARAIDLAPILLDADQAVADVYGVQVTPHLFLVDRGGKIRYCGAPDDVTFRQRVASRSYLEEAMQALLRRALPAVNETPAFGCALVRSRPLPSRDGMTGWADPSFTPHSNP